MLHFLGNDTTYSMQTPKPLGFEINLDRFKKSNPFVWAKGMEGYNRITTEDNPHFKELRHRKDLQPFLTEPYVDAESIGWLQAAKAMQELTTEIHTLDLYDVSKKSDCLLFPCVGSSPPRLVEADTVYYHLDYAQRLSRHCPSEA